MSLEQFNLNWHTYSDHIRELMETLMNTNKSADVTLVCNDKTKFKAHKFVLSACSPVFQSIIDDLPQREDSFIYLRGVEPQEMKSILQFMYLGQATFYHERMNEFLDVAKSLEIKEISKDVKCDDTFQGHNNDENMQMDNKIDTKDESSINQSYVLEGIGKTDKEVRGYMNESGQYQCSKCEKQFSDHQGLNKHSKSAHDGIRYPCNKCNKTFTQKINLKIHLQSIHEGVKFPCDLCDYEATQNKHLTSHIKRRH